MEALDTIDKTLLNLLQENAQTPQAELARLVGLTVSSVHERIKKLERRGVIRGYVALVDGAALGKPITAFIRVSVENRTGDASIFANSKDKILKLCQQEPDILECHHVAGEDCYIIKVRTTDPKGLEALLDRLLSGASVSRSVTNLVFSTYKENTAVSPAGD